ncbi:hypothetical protein Tco_1285509 [Tanacetum coccineum]
MLRSSLISPTLTFLMEIQRISLTGFPAQSVGSSNTDVLDSPCLLVLITGTSQSRQHDCSPSTVYVGYQDLLKLDIGMKNDMTPHNVEDGVRCLSEQTSVHIVERGLNRFVQTSFDIEVQGLNCCVQTSLQFHHFSPFYHIVFDDEFFLANDFSDIYPWMWSSVSTEFVYLNSPVYSTKVSFLSFDYLNPRKLRIVHELLKLVVFTSKRLAMASIILQISSLSKFALCYVALRCIEHRCTCRKVSDLTKELFVPLVNPSLEAECSFEDRHRLPIIVMLSVEKLEIGEAELL